MDSAAVWREVAMMRRCQHPRIVQLLGVTLKVGAGGRGHGALGRGRENACAVPAWLGRANSYRAGPVGVGDRTATGRERRHGTTKLASA